MHSIEDIFRVKYAFYRSHNSKKVCKKGGVSKPAFHFLLGTNDTPSLTYSMSPND